mgnify:CR=1 FL=1
MDVKCKDIHYSIGEKKILNGVSLEVEGGQFQTILGPNGSGKSTLLKTIYRQLKPDSGQIFLDGKSLVQVSLKDTAKEMAVVTKFNTLKFDCTVEEIVMLGRTPHLSFLQKESERDHVLVQDALDKVGMSEKKARYYSSLSGGEKQRVIRVPWLRNPNSFYWMSLPIIWTLSISWRCWLWLRNSALMFLQFSTIFNWPVVFQIIST